MKTWQCVLCYGNRKSGRFKGGLVLSTLTSVTHGYNHEKNSL